MRVDEAIYLLAGYGANINTNNPVAEAVKMGIEALEGLPSAQAKLDEWCTDCKEYDHEKHCCPRYNRVIREAVEEIKPERKSVIYYVDGYSDGCMMYDTAECPSCGYMFDEDDSVWKEPFCPHCGQELEWEGEQE